MANRIKGITVEIGGDTTGLTKALNDVNKEIKSTQAQLKDVEKLLKLDPTNTELIAQKQKLLAQSISETKEKLTALKGAQEDLDKALKNGDITQEQYDAWQREIIETENELKNLEKAAKDTDSSIQATLKAAGSKISEVGDKISGVGTTLSTHVTAPIVAVGAASIAAFNEVDSGYDTIIQKTGATGDALQSLCDSADNVFGSMPTDMDSVSVAIGEVNTKFALTGKALEDMSKEFIQFAEINDTDLNTSIDNTAKIIKAFGLETTDASGLLGLMTKQAQATGISVDTLQNSLLTNGSTLKEMGLNAAQSVNLLAQLEANGVDATTAMAGLKKALKNATADGLTMDEALKATVDSIKNASSETEALSIATELFGAKAAPEMVQAIKEGRLNFDDLSASMSEYSGVVGDTYDATKDGIDNFTTAMNNMKLAGAELGEAISNVLGPILQDLAQMIRGFTQWFSGLSDGTKEMIVRIALIVAAVGPVLVIVGKVISAVGSIVSGISGLMGLFSTLSGAISAIIPVIASVGLPVLAIVAAIAAVIAIGYLLITHWEEVKAVCISVWNAIAEFFSNLWQSITEVATAAWNGIATFFTNLWTGIQTVATTIWNAIAGFFSTVWTGIQSVVTTIVTAIANFLSAAWTAITTTITTILTAIQTVFTTIWTAIQTAITTIINAIATVITNVLNTIKNLFTTVWNGIKNTVTTVLNAIKSTVTSIWNAIVSGISNAMNNVVNTIKTGFNNAVGFIKGLASSAFSWGSDIINGIVDGIKSCIGKVKDAVSNVANTIKSFLHFSVPDEGPLTDYESWMPDFMSGLAQGIEKSRGMIASAVQGVASDMVISPTVAATQMAGAATVSGGTSDGSVSALLSGIREMVEAVTTQNNSTISIPVYLGNTLLDEVIVNAQSRQNLRSGGR